jgi:hypothetical protein
VLDHTLAIASSASISQTRPDHRAHQHIRLLISAGRTGLGLTSHRVGRLSLYRTAAPTSSTPSRGAWPTTTVMMLLDSQRLRRLPQRLCRSASLAPISTVTGRSTARTSSSSSTSSSPGVELRVTINRCRARSTRGARAPSRTFCAGRRGVKIGKLQIKVRFHRVPGDDRDSRGGHMVFAGLKQDLTNSTSDQLSNVVESLLV